jgi:hypothetical protein
VGRKPETDTKIGSHNGNSIPEGLQSIIYSLYHLADNTPAFSQLAELTGVNAKVIAAITRRKDVAERQVQCIDPALLKKFIDDSYDRMRIKTAVVAEMALSRVVELLSEGKTGQGAMWVAGVAIDKCRLLNGESTENIGVHVIIQARKELAAAKAGIEAIEAELVADVDCLSLS